MGRKKAEVKRSPEIAVRLLMPDYQRLTELSAVKGAPKTDLVREAIVQYLDRQNEQAESKMRDRLVEKLDEMEKRILAEQKRSTERLAKIGSRGLIDIATINQVLFARSDKASRRNLWHEAKQAALERLGVGKRKGDPDAAEVANAISGEA